VTEPPPPPHRPPGPPRPHLAGVPLARVAALVGDQPPAHDLLVTGVTHDSRSVRPGDLYAGLPGSRFHGADFAAAAAEAGALAVLTDPAGRARAAGSGLPVLVTADPRSNLGAVAAQVYGDPSDGLRLIGVTGTNGKTTVGYLLESGLRAAGQRTGLIGTIETLIDGETLPSARTTPEATDLQALFAVMRERGVEAAAMEVSSHALALHRVDAVRFDVAVFTNLSQDHLDFHADLASYFAAKAMLFTPQYSAAAVVNLDDEHGRLLAGRAATPTTTYSAAGDPRADWRAVDVDLGPAGSTFTLLGPDGLSLPASVRLPGAYNVANALAAIVGLVVAGTPAPAAVAGVAALAGVPGRMQRIDAGQDFLAVVDYAHTPDALRTLLGALRPVTAGRLIAVAGAGGDRDRGKRAPMGERIAELADVAVLTNDNPRSEDPMAILAALRTGTMAVPAGARARIVVEPDRASAIAYAVGQARPGDTVVVAGKGHEQGQEVQGVVRPFDDRHALREAIVRSRRHEAHR
jgi:UDP-N-acetylmuramoyl-L-alanyl-D-glutamate--2,6-diaminopimelate ligase